jgi:predicted AlkP superfamily phosphohydrolase/phosphomutase
MLIGLDAMDGDLIRQWAAEGHLPTMAALMQNSQWAQTQNSEGFYASVSIWPSFFTGSTPADHGRFAFRQLLPGSYHTKVTRPESLKAPSFWESLSQVGRRVALLDLPSAALYPQLNGIQLAYWGPHDIEGQCSSVPADLAVDILTRFGNEPVGQCDYGGRGPGDFIQFRDALLRRILKRVEFSLECLDREDWDLFAVAFSESHCIGHQAWHLHDPDHPAYDGALTRKIGDPMLAIYKAIDSAVGELVQRAGPDVRIMVFSSQGMGPAYSGNHLMAEILSRRGGSGIPGSSSGRLYRALLHLRARIPSVIHMPFKGLKNRVRNKLLSNDWADRDCFQIPSSTHGVSCLRFNITGREPSGKLRSGNELELFYDSLREDLESLVEPGTRRRLVKRVLRTDQLLSGPNCAAFPDILVEWDHRRPIKAIWSQATGLVEGVEASRRTGDHTPHGFVIVSGNGTGPLGRRVRVTDLAPTLLHWLGVESPLAKGKTVPEWL